MADCECAGGRVIMGKCEFCSEKEGTIKIGNPNLDYGSDIDWQDPKSWWMVCKPCSKFIVFRMFGSPPAMYEMDKELRDTVKNSFSAVIDLKSIKQKQEKGKAEE